MVGYKILKRKIIFFLALEGGFFNKSPQLFYYPYSFLYARLFSFKPSSIRGAVLSLVKDGLVDKIYKDKMALFRLTSKGRDILLSFFQVTLGLKTGWDGAWRLVLIKEKGNKELELKKVRQILKHLGFRKFSRGIYFSPLKVEDKLKNTLLEERISAKIAVIKTGEMFLIDNQELANQFWALEGITRDFNSLISRSSGLLRRFKHRKRLTDKGKNEFFLILDFYFTLLERTPAIPKNLVFNEIPLVLAQKAVLGLCLEAKKYGL